MTDVVDELLSLRIDLLLAALLFALGLWGILCVTPVVRHVWWYFSRSGRRHPVDFVPQWTKSDFNSFLLRTNRTFLHQLLTCSGCQSFHTSVIASLVYFAGAPQSSIALIVVLPVLLFIPVYAVIHHFTSHA